MADTQLPNDPSSKTQSTNKLGFPLIPSMTPSNQTAILNAAAGPVVPPAIPRIPKPTIAHLHIQSGFVPGSVPPSSTQLAPALVAELKNNTIAAGLEFLDLIFPQSRAPFTLDSKIFTRLKTQSIFTPGTNSFAPLSDFKESTVGKWLNDIGTALEKEYGVPVKRCWWHRSSVLSPGGSHLNLKPDLVLLDKEYHDTLSRLEDKDSCVNWLLVRSFTEVTAEKTTPQRMPATIDAKSYVLLTYQFDRRFVVALSITGSAKYTLTLSDREGQIRFQGTALTEDNKYNARNFLRILSFLMFGSTSDLGSDPHFIADPDDGKLIAVIVDNRRFDLTERIYTLGNMVGRGTKVWIVTSNNELYVMKDSWIQSSRCTSEVSHLRAMVGHDKIKGFVPAIVCGGDVEIDGVVDSTASYRSNSIGRVNRRRTHRRIVTSPVGDAITNFRSKKEFISAMMDITRAHEYLTTHLRILHRDISLGNVLLSRCPGNEVALGLLIDFDYSELMDDEGTSNDDVGTKELCSDGNVSDDGDGNGSDDGDGDGSDDGDGDGSDDEDDEEPLWTGTPPFMAIEALVNYGKPFIQRSNHDLESILYVILYVCTYTTGPGTMRKDTDIPKAMTIPLSRWFTKEYVKEIGRTKAGHMVMAEDSIISKFDEYWADFAPFVSELIETCFPSNTSRNSLTYASMLAILERAHDVVQDKPVQDKPVRDNPGDVRVGRAKRPRLEAAPAAPRAKKGKRRT